MTQIFGPLYSAAYDVLYADKNYQSETELIVQQFRRYRDRPVRTVLDFGCGTGGHALQLAATGHYVVGIDRSFEMLARASRKAAKLDVEIGFLQADMREVALKLRFDAAIMMFAVLSYQTTDEDLRRALGTARRHLQPKGLLVFDVWYGPAVLTQGVEKRSRVVKDPNGTWERVSSGKLDVLQRLCHVDFRVRHLHQGTVVDEKREHHVVHFFSGDEIERLLSDSGFRLLRLGAFPEFDRNPDRTTWNVMAVAAAV
jgi:SAM-dependent methyltransferase